MSILRRFLLAVLSAGSVAVQLSAQVTLVNNSSRPIATYAHVFSPSTPAACAESGAQCCPGGSTCSVTNMPGFVSLFASPLGDTTAVNWEFKNGATTIATRTSNTVSDVDRGATPFNQIIVTNTSSLPTVQLSVNKTQITETADAAGTVVVTATLSTTSATPVTVKVDLLGTASLNPSFPSTDDYTENVAEIYEAGTTQRNVYPITIPAGQLSATMTLVAKHDTFVEANETIAISIFSAGGAVATGSTLTVTILDDDALVTLSASPSSIGETGGISTVSATVSPVNPFNAVTVTLTFGGSATLTSDYTRSGTSITIPANQSSASISVNAVSDVVDEPDETVTVDISSVTNGAKNPSSVVETVTIVDDDVPTVSLSPGGSPMAETGGSATVTATLNAATFTPVTVNLGFAGTATLTSDYTRSGTSIMIPAGQTSGSITVTAVHDVLDESDETVVVNFASLVGASAGATTQVTATITDDDPMPLVTLSASASSMAENGGVVNVTGTLDAISGRDVTVDLTYSDSATNGVDYSGAASFVIPAGSISATIPVASIDDSDGEPDETITVGFASVTNGSFLGGQSVSFTIIDDDAPPVTLSITGATMAEAGGQATVTAAIPQVYVSPVTVTLQFSGAATAGTDFTGSTTITIPAGTTSGSTTLTATQDSLDEPDESIVIDIDSVTNGYESGTQQVTATIVDDDVPVVTLELTGSPLAENGGIATVTASLDRVSWQPVTVSLATSGTASGGEFTLPATIVVATGQLTGTASLTGVDDATFEPQESVIIDISSVTNGVESATPQQVTALINDDDTPQVTLEIAPAAINENGGAATVTAKLDRVSYLATTVTFAFGGTAAHPGDYVRSAGSVVIPAGSLSAAITLTSSDDADDEPDETITVDIDAVTNAAESGTQQVTATILDDDVPQVTLSISGTSLAENGGAATITATLDRPSWQTVDVTLGFTGTADSPGDYARSGTSISIASGNLSGNVTITSTDDSADEPDESVVVDVTGVTNGAEIGTQQVTATIVDDDVPQVTLELAGDPVAENGGVATFTAKLDRASWQAVTVNLAISGTATAADFTASATSIVIPIGSTTGSITVTGLDDALDEADETVVVEITGVVNAVESGTQQATATIVDDDAPQVTLSLSGSPIAEAGGIATVTATLDRVSWQTVTVNLGLAGTAAPGDYSASSLAIVIPAGSLTGDSTLTAIDDTADEPDETIIVDVTSVTNGTESGTQQVTATITDDDVPQVTLELAGSPFAENGGSATVTVRLDRASWQNVTTTLSFGGTATAVSDYTVSPDPVTITAGALFATATLSAVDDSIDESDESVVVDIASVTNGAESGAQQVTATITDDDVPQVSLALTGSPVAENGGTATVTATLDRVSWQDVTVTLSFSGVAALSTDYSTSASSITIPAGSSSGDVTLTATDDTADEPDESIVVDIDSVTNAAENGAQQASATITDDDVPLVTLELAGSPFAENAGLATVTARLDRPSWQDVSVTFTFGGTAAFPGDYVRSNTMVMILAGNLTAGVTLTGVDDPTDEWDETVVVDIASVTNATEDGTQQVTAAIADDDAEPVAALSLSGSPIAENGGITTATVTLSAISEKDVTVGLALSGTAGAGDFTTAPTSFTISAGSSSGAMQINATDDALDEDDESVIVDIASLANATESASGQVTATITDDDPLPAVTLQISAATLAENGGTATITAALNAVSGRDVIVTLASSGPAASNYSLADVQLTIPAGSLSATTTIASVDDAMDEIDELVTVDLTAITNGVESGVQQVTTLILDDDLPPTVTLTLTGDPFEEDGGVAVVNAVLSAPSGKPVTVTLGYSGTASAADYVASGNSIAIAPGSASGSVTLTGLDDAILDAGETVIVDLTSATNATESGVQQIVATITDDDPAALVFLTQPADTPTDTPFEVAVQVVDSSGRPVNASAFVKLSLGTNPSAGKLDGMTETFAIGGIATFTELSVNRAGSGYTLVASSAGLVSATSAPFEVTPVAVTSFTGQSVTGKGLVAVTFTGGGPLCSFVEAELQAAPSEGSAQPPLPLFGRAFPYGLFRYLVSDCEPGSEVVFTITYPRPLPPGTQYWKFGPTAPGGQAVWYQIPATVMDNVVTFKITDGGLGDDDGVANGSIVDPGGPAVPATSRRRSAAGN